MNLTKNKEFKCKKWNKSDKNKLYFLELFYLIFLNISNYSLLIYSKGIYRINNTILLCLYKKIQDEL